MFKAWLVGFAFCMLVVIGNQSVYAQASKKLQERSVDAQKKSWEQVDQINREADGTRARYNQAQRSGVDKRKYTGGNITRSSIFPKTPKQRSAVKKEETAPKKKKKQ